MFWSFAALWTERGSSPLRMANLKRGSNFNKYASIAQLLRSAPGKRICNATIRFSASVPRSIPLE